MKSCVTVGQKHRKSLKMNAQLFGLLNDSKEAKMTSMYHNDNQHKDGSNKLGTE